MKNWNKRKIGMRRSKAIKKEKTLHYNFVDNKDVTISHAFKEPLELQLLRFINNTNADFIASLDDNPRNKTLINGNTMTIIDQQLSGLHGFFNKLTLTSLANKTEGNLIIEIWTSKN